MNISNEMLLNDSVGVVCFVFYRYCFRALCECVHAAKDDVRKKTSVCEAKFQFKMMASPSSQFSGRRSDGLSNFWSLRVFLREKPSRG